MKGNIWTVAILVIVLGVATVGIAGLISSASSGVSVTAENVTLDPNGTQLAEASDAVQLYQNETITIENGTNRTTLDRGTDYLIDYDTGVLEPNRSQYNGSDVLVNYTVSQPDSERTTQIAALLSLLNGIWPILIVLAILATTWSLASGWW